MFALSWWAYYHLPDKAASHWNVTGEVDGYSSRFAGAFLMPIITIIIYGLFYIFPKIDPKKENVAKFINLYWGFVNIFLGYMLYIHLLTIAANLGYNFDMIRAMLPGFAVLFYYIGWMLPQAKPNWFLGIRTAWTLSSDEVWQKTHELGGRCFRYSGVIVLLGIFFTKYAIFFAIIPVLASSLYLVIFSYLEYKKLSLKGIKQ